MAPQARLGPVVRPQHLYVGANMIVKRILRAKMILETILQIESKSCLVSDETGLSSLFAEFRTLHNLIGRRHRLKEHVIVGEALRSSQKHDGYVVLSDP
jgi:hypothetical protein